MGTFGAILEYGVKEQITEHSSLGATVEVGKQHYIKVIYISYNVNLWPVFEGTMPDQ